MSAQENAEATISIHALRKESDPPAKSATRPTRYFNPRSP